MDRFGFIFHPHDLIFYADGFNEPQIKMKRPSLVIKTMEWFPPFRRSVVSGIKSKYTGEIIEGDMILLNLLPEHILHLKSDFVFSKLVEAGKLAEKLGDKIVGLGAYAALIGNRGLDLSKQLNIPVTNGNTYTVASVPDIVIKVLKAIDKELSNSNILIIGATTTVGKICCEKLSNKCKVLYLIAKDYRKITQLYSDRQYMTIDKNDIEKIKTCINKSDLIVLTSHSLSRAVLNFDLIKTGTVIYDATYPKFIKPDLDKKRKDLLIIDGEAIKLPGRTNFHFSFGFPPSLAYACMAETMILTFENKFESYSIGKKIDFTKIDEISNLANKHGFKLEEFTRGGKVINSRRLKEVKLMNSR